MAAQERRRKPRVPLGTEAIIEDAGEKTKGYAVDLAAQGIAVLCHLDPEVGKPVKVHFLLPNGGGWMVADATLVRAAKRGGDTLWGLQFKQPDNRTQSLIERFVREQLVTLAREKHHGREAQASRARERLRQENPFRRLLRALGLQGGKRAR